MAHENRVLLLALAAGAAGVAFSLILVWAGDYAARTRWTLTLLLLATWLIFGFSVRGAVMRPLQTLSNLQAALREGDFSIRARGADPSNSLGELIYEFNALSESLRQQRLGALESHALLARVMTEIEVAVFAFDSENRLRLANRAGERLIGRPAEHALGVKAAELGLEDLLEGEGAHTFEREFPGASGRWAIRRSTFRQGGVPHQLVVVADLSRALREEERQAWQRLVRVLGHELNNSLAPIMSITQSLETLVRRDIRPDDWEDDLRRGLHVINQRAEALSRFMRDYARLARLPQPNLQPVDFATLFRRVVALEQRRPIEVIEGPQVTIQADPAQLEQLLINLLQNAVDASAETCGRITAGWSRNGAVLQVWICDEGAGISNPANLFVPFFTTKPGGSGIGLSLSRQIAEAHGGSLHLVNRKDTRGAEARVELPLRGGDVLRATEG